MKSYKINIFKNYIIAILSIIILNNCKGPDAEKEVQKILDKQATVLEKEQQSVEEIFEMTKDSIEKQEKLLLSRKKSIESQMAEFEEMKKEEELSDLKTEKTLLKDELKNVIDSLEFLKNKLTKLQQKSKNISVKEEQLIEQKSEAKNKMLTGIENIDARLDKIEEQRLIKQKEIDINKRKVNLANEKIKLLEDEINIYKREKNDLALEDESSEEIKKFENKIVEIEQEIEDEKEKINRAEKVISSNNKWVNEFSALKEKLKAMMNKEYDKKATIDTFTQNEMTRLKKEVQSIENEKKELLSAQKNLAEKQTLLNQKLNTIDDEIEILMNPELSDLLKKKSLLELEEAEISGEEAKMKKTLTQSSGEEKETDTGILGALEKEIQAKRREINRIKAELAEEQQIIATNQAEIDAKRSKKTKTAKSIFIIVLIGILVVAGLYYLGMKNRKKKKAKQ